MKHTVSVVSLMIAFAISILLTGLGQVTASAGTLAIGRISGSVWQDSNNNGVREPQELPLAGYPVYLQQVGSEAIGAMVAVTYTDGDGSFMFNSLEEGKFQVFTEEGDHVLVEVVGVEATATVDLPVPVQFHRIFLPVTIR